MGALLKSVGALYLAVAAMGAVVVGLHLLLPVSGLDLPGIWVTPAILAVVGGTMAVSSGLFWLSDLVVRRLIGSPDRHVMAITPRPCFLCGAELLRDALTCPAFGALVRERRRPRGATARGGDQ